MHYHDGVRSAAEWVYGARRGAGLSQRELATQSGVPQPTIARVERGKQVPRVDTLMRLLDACGFELRLGPKRGLEVDISLIDEMLELTPSQRAERVAAYGRFGDRLRAARRVS